MNLEHHCALLALQDEDAAAAVGAHHTSHVMRPSPNILAGDFGAPSLSYTTLWHSKFARICVLGAKHAQLLPLPPYYLHIFLPYCLSNPNLIMGLEDNIHISFCVHLASLFPMCTPWWQTTHSLQFLHSFNEWGKALLHVCSPKKLQWCCAPESMLYSWGFLPIPCLLFLADATFDWRRDQRR